MDDRTLLGVIGQFEQESYGFSDGELQAQRSYAIDRYLGAPFGDEVEGRSQVVSTDLRDVIEWVLPQCLRVFLSGDQVVKFQPQGPEDEQAAELETNYVNYVILERNDAFNVFSTWFRDALMSKVGYTKAYWKVRSDIKLEEYHGLTDDMLAVLEADKDVEVVAQSDYPDTGAAPPMPAAQAMSMGQGPMSPPQQPMLHDVKVRRVKDSGHVCIDNVPPEEIRVHNSHRKIALDDCLFLQHETRQTISQLRQYGYDIPDDMAEDADDSGQTTDAIEIARDRFADDHELFDDQESVDPATRYLRVRESYLRVDYDGDGVAELRKVCHVGSRILKYTNGEMANEETDMVPFAAITPIVFPHRHIGIGFDDLTRQVGEVKTQVVRQFLDNLYLANNGRYAIDVQAVNVDDMLVSRPGGIVRTTGNPGTAIMPLTHPTVGQSALEGLQFVDSWRENSVGVSAYYQGLNADALNKTATGISQIMTASQGRVEAVTRSFASGMKDLFALVHALTLKNATSDEKLKLNGQWATVNPREWVKRTDMTITVGLGSGTRESRIQQLGQLMQIQMQGLQLGICNPENVYHTGAKIAEEMGYRNVQDYFTDPAQQPPQPHPPPPEVMAAQIKAQSDQQIAGVRAQADQSIQQARANADMQVQQHKVQTDAQLELEKTRMQLQLDDFKHSREQQTQIEIAKIKAAAQVQAADITASKQQADSMYAQEMSQ
jgi:hypothetical protein